MGGLDSRAYVENMASAGACYDYTNNTPRYSWPCNPGSTAYANDVANVITVDTPNAGSPLAKPNGLLGAIGIETACQAYSSTNMMELAPLSQGGAGLIEVLNYNGFAINNVQPSTNSVPIQAVEDYLRTYQQRGMASPGSLTTSLPKRQPVYHLRQPDARLKCPCL